MVIDKKVAISCSFNYTDDANRYNDENVFFMHNEDIARHYATEIERIYNQLAQDL